MNHFFEMLRVTLTQEETVTQTGVLVPLCWDPNTQTFSLLLTKRTTTVETHKGQISFPGGYREESDEGLLETALREAQEEVGINPKDVEIAGRLDPVLTRGGIQITPWVAKLQMPYVFTIHPEEVEKLLFLPLQRVIDDGLQQGQLQIDGKAFKTPTIEVDGEIVWGATASIIQQLRSRLIVSR